MIFIQEYFEVVDKDDRVIGKALRSECHSNPALIHRGIYVIITNPKGEYLLQKRSMKKDTNPGKWDFAVAGHNNIGESYEKAAVRETKEELGIDVNLKIIGKLLIRFSNETEIDTIFHSVTKKEKLTLYKEEVEEAKFFSLSSMKKLAVTEKFWEIMNFYISKSAK